MAEHLTLLVSIKNRWTVSLKNLMDDGAALHGKTICLQMYYVKNYTETIKGQNSTCQGRYCRSC